MNKRDQQLINSIFARNDDLNDILVQASNDREKLLSNKVLYTAAEMMVLQIGENVSKLSDDVLLI